MPKYRVVVKFRDQDYVDDDATSPQDAADRTGGGDAEILSVNVYSTDGVLLFTEEPK